MSGELKVLRPITNEGSPSASGAQDRRAGVVPSVAQRAGASHPETDGEGEHPPTDSSPIVPSSAARPSSRAWRDPPQYALVDHVLKAGLLFMLATAAAVVLAPRLMRDDLPDDVKALGTPARAFVKADRDYAVVDVEATTQQRDAAARRSPSVWDLDTAAALRDAQVLHKGLLRLTVALEPVREAHASALASALKIRADDAAEPSATATPSTTSTTSTTPALLDTVRLPSASVAVAEPVRAVLAGDLALMGVEAPTSETWTAMLKAMWFAPSALDGINGVLVRVLAEPVVADRNPLARDAGRGILVRAVSDKAGGEHLLNVAGVLDVGSARAQVERELVSLLRSQASVVTEPEAMLVARFVASFVRPTLTYNAAETDVRRRYEAATVPPLVVRANRGEIVLRPGEIITSEHRLLVQAMRLQQAGDMRTRAVLGTAFLVVALCLVVYLFGARRVFRRTLRVRDVAFLSSLVLAELLGIVAADAAAALLDTHAPGIPPRVLFFGVPVAFAAMTARLTLPPEVALLLALVVSLLGGVVVEPGMAWTVVAVVSSLTGAAGVSRSQQRAALLFAGLAAGVVGAFTALTLELFRGALTGIELVWLLGATVSGGILSGIFVVLVTPLVEALFGYVTEARLYRLADLNHPLLKDLIVHAPGTWHHSMRVAEIAEAAARSVGASPLLARVMALYHDIGKIRQPQLFNENQKGDNPHERMPPKHSAALILAHVDHGLALAAEHDLPHIVTAAIEEHHMDSVLETFYARARLAADTEVVPDVAGFRYRGRPPQTRESALVMLADHIEAAARSLEAGGPDKLRSVVDAFFNQALVEDALSACDLSLRELALARDAMHRALLRVHRQEES